MMIGRPKYKYKAAAVQPAIISVTQLAVLLSHHDKRKDTGGPAQALTVLSRMGSSHCQVARSTAYPLRVSSSEPARRNPKKIRMSAMVWASPLRTFQEAVAAHIPATITVVTALR